jgi:hypothetical protein
MDGKPKVVVARKLPEAVEARLLRDYDPLFNPDDHVLSTDELVARADGAQALLPCHSEQLSAAAIARLPDSVNSPSASITWIWTRRRPAASSSPTRRTS